MLEGIWGKLALLTGRPPIGCLLRSLISAAYPSALDIGASDHWGDIGAKHVITAHDRSVKSLRTSDRVLHGRAAYLTGYIYIDPLLLGLLIWVDT